MSIRKYKAVQALAHQDTRTAGQRRAAVGNWANPPYRPLTQINRRREPDPVPAALTAWQFWVCVCCWSVCMAFGLWLAGWL